ncbi:MAG: hypothetical protein ABIY47_10525, partial [Opitutaceae bacterium]
MSVTLLLVKKQRDETHVRSVVVSETGLYWRSAGRSADLSAVLQKERFEVVIVDYRGTPGDPLEFIETIRSRQTEAKFFLVCDQPELGMIIRAIRVGIRDLFHPPIDFRAIVDRLNATISAGDMPPLPPDHWSDLEAFLAGAVIPASGDTRPPQSKDSSPSLEPGRGEQEALVAELAVARATA